MNNKFHGIIPPVLTPFTEDSKVDHEGLRTVTDRMINAGVHGLFALGSTSGTAFMTNAQRIEVMQTIVDVNNGRVPILMGEINMNALRCIEQIQNTLDALGERASDIDGLVCAAPFYALGDAQNTELHFRTIHEAFPELPLFAYDIPVCVHQKLSIDMLIRLGSEGVLAGVKDSSGDDVSFRMLILANDEAGHPLQLFTGHEIVVDGALLGGADGVVPGLANVDPDGYVKMYEAAVAGDWEQVKLLQDYCARLMRIAMCAKDASGFSAGVGGFKTALMLMGTIKSNYVEKPGFPLQGEDVDRIRQILIDENLL